MHINISVQKSQVSIINDLLLSKISDFNSVQPPIQGYRHLGEKATDA